MGFFFGRIYVNVLYFWFFVVDDGGGVGYWIFVWWVDCFVFVGGFGVF